MAFASVWMSQATIYGLCTDSEDEFNFRHQDWKYLCWLAVRDEESLEHLLTV